MVPVPEEHLAEVLAYLRWGFSGMPSEGWDLDAIAQLLRDARRAGRRLLLHTADAAERGVILTIADAATAAGCSEREVLGMLIELNEAVRSAGGPLIVLATAMLHDTTETGPNVWSINMPRDVALFMLNAAGRGVAVPPQDDRRDTSPLANS